MADILQKTFSDIFIKENACILIHVSLKFIPESAI